MSFRDDRDDVAVFASSGKGLFSYSQNSSVQNKFAHLRKMDLQNATATSRPPP